MADKHRAPEMAPIMVDPAPLLALRVMLDQVLANALAPQQSCCVLELDLPDRSDSTKPWVAELVVTAHGFQRAFLRGRRDYTHADKKGRGVRENYVLRPGCVYEVQEVNRRGVGHRYTCRIQDGKVSRLEPEEVQRWADGLLLAGLR